MRFPKKDALIKLQKLTAGSPHHFQDAIIEDHKSIFIYDPYQSDMTDMHGTDVALILVHNFDFQTDRVNLQTVTPYSIFTDSTCYVIGFPAEDERKYHIFTDQCFYIGCVTNA